MATVTPSKIPGNYVGSIDLDWSFSSDVKRVAWTLNDLPPVLSEYIAYDQLTPPNPFIGVTQDGRGRIVYDGGFPKMQNGSWNGATTFAGLSGAHKYVHNALKWVADPKKVAAGNNKFLFLGNAPYGASYCLIDSDSFSFLTTLNGICAIAGITPTYKIRTSYPAGNLNPTLDELEQYAGVFIMSSTYTTSTTELTDNAVRDLITYRRQGGGLVIMTDHGSVIPNIQQAYPVANQAWFAMANKLAVNFGAYFSGDYNRTPVNVGFLRSTYGDHPLYNGLLDSEDIWAGGSESKLIVNSATLIDPEDMPTVTLTKLGLNQINFLLELEDGSVETFVFLYTTGGSPIVQFTNTANVIVSAVDTGYADTVALRSHIVGVDGLGTIIGDLYLNDEVVGSLKYTQGVGSVDVWFGGNGTPFKINNGDKVIGKLREPFEYTTTVDITRFQPNLEGPLGYGELVSLINTPTIPANQRVAKLFTAIYDYLPPSSKVKNVNLGKIMSVIKQYMAH
ncbi:virion structural protein [Pseudomonas phage Psa21]|uniref:Virion structural protein n=1 Tax=Pseudomonas phage Psa21 TaxID=2530023 RepID=A0A481W4R8_9CAUD|nr:virion structural protein [Pseudomonas phage Psa21]QBJ02796.1 hypothetical protein PSA21_270 [Pseudomonas phage Psa21]